MLIEITFFKYRCIGIHGYNTFLAFSNSRMTYFTWITPCIMEYQDIGLRGSSTLMVTVGSGGSFLLNIRYDKRLFMLLHEIRNSKYNLTKMARKIVKYLTMFRLKKSYYLNVA